MQRASAHQEIQTSRWTLNEFLYHKRTFENVKTMHIINVFMYDIVKTAIAELEMFD